MTIQDDDLITLGPWKGLDNVTDEAELAPDRARQADNVAFSRTGRAHRRIGYTKRKTTTSSHSLFAHEGSLIYVDNGSLVRCHVADYSTEVLASVSNALAVSYAQATDRLYWTNGQESGCLHDGWTPTTWGVPNPPRQPTVSATTGGSLPAGQYQVAVTFIDAYGEESGTGPAASIAVASGQAIQLEDIPQSASAAYVRLYCTPVNGDEFFWQTDLAMGVTSYRMYSMLRSRVRLQTQFCAPMPAGQIVRYFRGRLLVAKDNAIFYSEPLRYGLYKPLDNYLPPVRDRIVVMEPVEDGIWVVTKRQTWFYSGQNPEQMVPIQVYPHGGVEGTGRQVPAHLFNVQAPGYVAYWFGERGGVLGLPSGQIQPYYEDAVAVDQYEAGATAIFEKDGLRQVISAVRGLGASSSLVATDTIEAEVRKSNVKRLSDGFVLSDAIDGEVA